VSGGRSAPVPGCWVRRKGTQNPLGHVVAHGNEADQVRVEWGGGAARWERLEDLEPGFQANWAVQDTPRSATRRPLGPGRVVGRRQLGGRHQILVQLDGDGRSVWLPYENLKRIKDPRLRYERKETGAADHAERFRLRLLAHALENWNQLTGSLDRLDVDPLPHQIQLVHRILSSNNFNWLIADDVGLGKTIEVGLLLAALKRKGQARRVLVVAPAGLTRQWQDELRYKFDQVYEIYGRDFQVHDVGHWKLHDHVIVSIDLAKRDEHLQVFRQAGGWDVVVFDEGHKLTRHASGERAQRFILAETLRPLSDAFLLLSGTPHQGYVDRFIALLELVRPDLRQQIHTLAFNPEVVGEMILRNRKSEVTDAEGNFIFKGQRIHRVAIEPSSETRTFQRLLQAYLARGYNAGAARGAAGRAIGFVMTTYRKLASSSIAAIERALRLRLERLNHAMQRVSVATLIDLSFDELAEGGDEQDDLPEMADAGRTAEFFADEKEAIETLLSRAAVVRKQDEKLRLFLEEVAASIVESGRKLLIFTEYRATQEYLEEALRSRFPGAGDVTLINGSMSLDEKLSSIARFNGDARFMISTEAGGEGINLQQSCHVMLNYDLPWNPARLVQRIGRLYRYGQKETVIVFNLHAEDSFDNQAISLMLDRVLQIARDMAPVGEEYNDRLYADIVGDLLETVDLASLLQGATSMEMAKTREQIERALERAREARRMQEELFTHVSGYDPHALHGTLGFTMQHVDLFIAGMLPLVGASLDGRLHGGRLLEVRLPETLRGRFPEFGNRTVVRLTTDRRLRQQLKDVVLLDFEAPFFQFLIEAAKAHEFNGIYSAAVSPAGVEGALAAFKLRWQNDQGDALTEEFLTLFCETGAPVRANPPFLVNWLLSPLGSASPPEESAASRKETFQRLLEAAQRRLGTESSQFKHPNGLIELAAADCRPLSGT